MSEVLSLVAQMRDDLGTGSARALRRNGMVPATIYGAGKEPLSIAVEEKELTKYYRKPQYITQVIQFEIGEKKHKVLPKDIQLNPITEVVSHADFVFLQNKTQKLKVPVVYLNNETSVGVKKGGYFNTVKRFLTIICPVDNLPRKIEINTADMPIGRSIKASEAVLPEGAKLVDNPNSVIASIVGKKGKASEDDDAAATTDEKAATPAAASK
jgi:large subunit ribosomal protein L25